MTVKVSRVSETTGEQPARYELRDSSGSLLCVFHARNRRERRRTERRLLGISGGVARTPLGDRP